ncbi:MAG: hypothetical protein AAF927_34120 [Bacteroidota bacterium]
MPQASVLAANQIQKIEVKWVTLPSLSPKGKPLPDGNTYGKGFFYKTYFINTYGLVDSIHRMNGEREVFEKQIFAYDTEQRLIKLATIKADGSVKNLQTVCKTSEGDWHYQIWNHGNLEREVISRTDSLVERTIYHRQNAYCVEAYDFEQEVNTRTWYNNEIMVYHEKYQWITQDGKPEKVAYSEYQLEDGKEKNFTRDYPLLEDGNLVGHETNWLGTDVNWFANYFTRIDVFLGIQYPHEASFEEDDLIKESSIVEIGNYDGTRYRHYYTFEYE